MVLNPPNIILLPSNGILLISQSFNLGSVIAALFPASRASFDGHTIHEKTTTSSDSHLTAIGRDVNVPSGTSSAQFSTTDRAP